MSLLKKTTKYFVIIICPLFFVNFMFFKKHKTGWEQENGLFLRVALWTGNENLPEGFSEIQIKALVLSVLNQWGPEKTGAKIDFSHRGFLKMDRPFSPPEIGCGAKSHAVAKVYPLSVFSNPEDDPDCSADSCAYVWVCDKTIIHSDIQINTNGRKWVSEPTAPYVQCPYTENFCTRPAMHLA